jgi:hypothetical protein
MRVVHIKPVGTSGLGGTLVLEGLQGVLSGGVSSAAASTGCLFGFHGDYSIFCTDKSTSKLSSKHWKRTLAEIYAETIH